MTLSRRSLFASVTAALVAGTAKVVAAKVPAAPLVHEFTVSGGMTTIIYVRGYLGPLRVPVIDSATGRTVCFGPGTYRIDEPLVF